MSETMVVCVGCSTVQTSGSNYCPKCGNSVKEITETPATERQVRLAKYLILFGYCLVVTGLPMHGQGLGHYLIALGFLAVFGGCQWLAVQ